MPKFQLPKTCQDQRLKIRVNNEKLVSTNWVRAGARFSKAPKSFRARKAIFSSSVSKNGEVYTPETSCMKRTSVHIETM